VTTTPLPDVVLPAPAVLPRARGRDALWLGAGVIVLALSMLAGLFVGAVDIPPQDIVGDLISRIPFVHMHSPLSSIDAAIVWQLRLPRVVLGALVGGMLALCGAAYQGIFRNPLADPYLLGVAAGAGLGATIAIVFAIDITVVGVHALPMFAFVGAIIAVGLAYVVGRSVGAGRSSTTLVLGGVAVAAFLTAMQTFLQQRHTDQLALVYNWILGTVATDGWSEVITMLPYALLALVVILLHGRLLDVMGLGDDAARTLGVRTGQVRIAVIGAVTIGTAAAVAVTGLIGFVGLIIPHVVRLLGIRTHRTLLPLSMLLGASFLVLCDLVARTAVSPSELPIGVVTAVIGAPAFALVLRTSRVHG
jgi:iron complex transport system permease protein